MYSVLRHKVKRTHPEPAPHTWRAAWVRAIDIIVYPMGFLGIASALPQVIEVWVNQNAAGVSVVTWGMLGVLAVVWTLYGIAHKARVLVLINSLWIVVNFAVAFGAHLYG